MAFIIGGYSSGTEFEVQIVMDYQPGQWIYADGVEQDAQVKNWREIEEAKDFAKNRESLNNILYGEMFPVSNLNPDIPIYQQLAFLNSKHQVVKQQIFAQQKAKSNWWNSLLITAANLCKR